MIKFISPNSKDTSIRVSIKHYKDGEYEDATIYYDHVAVAFFNPTDGSISAIPFEIRENVDASDSEQVEYLRSKGVKLNSEATSYGYVYYLKTNVEFY